MTGVVLQHAPIVCYLAIATRVSYAQAGCNERSFSCRMAYQYECRKMKQKGSVLGGVLRRKMKKCREES